MNGNLTSDTYPQRIIVNDRMVISVVDKNIQNTYFALSFERAIFVHKAVRFCQLSQISLSEFGP